MSEEWCLIESDPGVFTELIKGFGVEDAQVEEMFSLDDSSFDDLKPVYGLVFLFKWLPGDHNNQGSVVMDSRRTEIFFAKQVITNACATQAILSILLNCEHADFKLGKTLTDLKDFSITLPPEMKGQALTNADIIRKVHNSFARQQMFDFDKSFTSKDDDVFHFVAFVPIKGRLYELDGLQEGPIDLGPCDQEDWLSVAKPLLDERMQSFSEGEIHFNLMAVVGDRRKRFVKEIERLESRRDLAAKMIEAIVGGEDVEAMMAGSDLPSDPDVLQMVIESSQAEVANLQANITEEDRKMEQYRIENIRRRHNFLPLVIELLKILAKKGQLVPLTEKAKEKAAKETTKKKKKSS
ncbi:ubiquitin carboxyl-terminal hydrolase isozyme L5-like [Dysidea avara]|uniref:ubiquitin carboxyl-terminal hydrolase isozyme L5-like n=1 Tax=Dysidea avara TaxID=196820 RepID=UPI003324DE4A